MYIDVSNTKPWFSCRHLLVFFVWTWPIKLNYRKCICQKPKLTKLLYRKCIFLDTYGCAPQSIPQNPCPGLCLLRPCLDSHAKTSCCPTTSCAFDLLGDSSWIRHRPSKSSQNMPKMSVFKRMMMLNIIFNILKNHEKKHIHHILDHVSSAFAAPMDLRVSPFLRRFPVDLPGVQSKSTSAAWWRNQKSHRTCWGYFQTKPSFVAIFRQSQVFVAVLDSTCVDWR